jgi:hypothetical protein
MKRQRRSRDEMASLLARKTAEGLTYQQLTELSGIPLSTIASWARRLRQESVESFVEVRVEPDHQAAPLVVLTASGHRIAVPPSFDEATLARLLRMLAC